MAGIRDKAMLVSLKISVWSATRIDKKVTKEILEIHGSENGGKFNKYLVDKAKLDDIQRLSGEIRKFHRENTLPWGKDGDRILPSVNYKKYAKEMSNFKAEFDKYAKDFIDDYKNMIQEARYRLNGMFNENDYPADIATKFMMAYNIFPVPDAEDFRLDITGDEVKKIKDDMEVEINNRVANATRSIYDRIIKRLTHIHEKLSDTEAVFRDSLMGNLKELIELLPNLNVSADPFVNDMIGRLQDLYCDPNHLRKSPIDRAIKTQQVEELIKRMEAFVPAESEVDNDLY